MLIEQIGVCNSGIGRIDGDTRAGSPAQKMLHSGHETAQKWCGSIDMLLWAKNIQN